MNELDRFVRHGLRPQAYIRYGDDFILFASTCRAAAEFCALAERFLQTQLQLALNPKNDVIVRAAAGLKFLGHDVSAKNIVVDRHTTKKVLSKISPRSVASYRSLYLPPEARKELDWILFEEYVDISELFM
ncbi:MAG: hypothetical protein ACREGA_01915 [Candidatus Saccharimonadales bacterium]